jgi:hypothetical protein
MMNRIFPTTLLVSALLFFPGCSTVQAPPATTFTSYEDFYPGPEDGVDLVWTRADLRDKERLRAKLALYDTVVLERIDVVVGNSALDNEEIESLIAYMSKRLKEEISPRKAFVEEPGANTLRLRIAISNVETPNPILAATSSILPVGVGISVISRITTGEPTNVGEATIELMLSESLDDLPILAAIDRRVGNKGLSSIVDTLDDAKDVIDWWVERLAITLSQWQLPQ